MGSKGFLLSKSAYNSNRSAVITASVLAVSLSSGGGFADGGNGLSHEEATLAKYEHFTQQRREVSWLERLRSTNAITESDAFKNLGLDKIKGLEFTNPQPMYIENEWRGVGFTLRLNHQIDLKGPWTKVDVDALLRAARPDLGPHISANNRMHDEIDLLFAAGRKLSADDYITITRNIEYKNVNTIYVAYDLKADRVIELSPLIEPETAPEIEQRSDPVPEPVMQLTSVDKVSSPWKGIASRVKEAFTDVGELLLPAQVNAHTAVGWVWIGQDKIYNWDHRAKNLNGAKDWPVHIVFWNNATVNKVKGTDGTHRLDNTIFKTTGGAKYLRLNDGAGWAWDSDKGRKKDNCDPIGGAPGWTQHYRVYADSDDRMWSPGWGFHVAMTAHYDFDDLSIPVICTNRKHGWDELASEWLEWYYSMHQDGPFWGVISDWRHIHNAGAGQVFLGGILHNQTSDGSVSVIRAN